MKECVYCHKKNISSSSKLLFCCDSCRSSYLRSNYISFKKMVDEVDQEGDSVMVTIMGSGFQSLSAVERGNLKEFATVANQVTYLGGLALNYLTIAIKSSKEPIDDDEDTQRFLVWAKLVINAFDEMQAVIDKMN